jgi:hypothetical protein
MRGLNEAEKKEIERLQRQKDGVIYRCMGACEHIDDQIKGVKNGSWYREHKKDFEGEAESEARNDTYNGY